MNMYVLKSMDTNVLREIAQHDFRVWIAMSMTCKELNTIMNIYECEKLFTRTIWYPGRTIRLLGGKLHSSTHPAIEWASGKIEYYFKGKHHSYTHPALQYTELGYNYEIWKVNGKYHRTNPDGTVTEPSVIVRGGSVVRLYYKALYYKSGKLHRDGYRPAVVDNNPFGRGEEYWYEGTLHREEYDCEGFPTVSNLPTITRPNGWKYWYLNGVLHSPSPDLPATIAKVNGGETKRWYFRGKLHRIGGPAIMSANGDTVWYYNGLEHRGPENDPSYDDQPAEVRRHTTSWYRHGALHRDGDLPGEISPDSKRWYMDGELHRLTGPAYIGTYSVHYYIYGLLRTEEEFNREIEIMNIYC
jgi:hypothetical protein